MGRSPRFRVCRRTYTFQFHQRRHSKLAKRACDPYSSQGQKHRIKQKPSKVQGPPRNQFIFSHQTLNPHQTLLKATTSKDCFSAWNRKALKKNQSRGEFEKWHPPAPGTLIVNIDASFEIICDASMSPERYPHEENRPISPGRESRSPAQPEEDRTPLGIYSHRAEEQGRNIPLHSNFPPTLHTTGPVENGCLHLTRRINAAKPFAFASEDQHLQLSTSWQSSRFGS